MSTFARLPIEGGGGGAAVWGGITGTLSDQTDLQSALNAKEDTITTLPINKGGTGLGALGTASQQLRVNGGATALEYFTPAAAVASVSSNVLDVSGTTAIVLAAKAVSLATQSGGGATIDLSLSPSHHLVLTAACAITLSNPANGGSYVIEIVQGVSPFAVTWASTVLWGPQGAPDFTALTTGQFGIVNIFRDYNNRYVGSYYLGYGP
jgi:hypothetical protein